MSYCALVRIYLSECLIRGPRVPVFAAGLACALALAGCGGPRHVENAGSAPADCFELSGGATVRRALPVERSRGSIVEVTEHGIATQSSLDEGAHWSASPIERIGLVALERRDARALWIRGVDSAGIRGRVCIRTGAHPGEDLFGRASRAAAAGAQATAMHDWPRAFDSYQTAARLYQIAHDGKRASVAWHAAATLAYRQMSENRLASALTSLALSVGGDSLDRDSRAALVELLAMSRMDVAGDDPKQAREALLALLARAEKLSAGSLYGRRESPRIDILRGFLDFSADDLPAASGWFERAAKRCEALADWECYARATQNHVQSSEGSADFPTLLSGYRSALARLDPELQPRLAAEIWENLGSLQSRLALTQDGEQSYASAIALYAEVRDCDGTRRTLSRLGSLALDVGNPGDAQFLLRAAARESCSSLLEVSRHRSSLTQLSDAFAEHLGPAGPEPCRAPRSAAGLSEEGRYAVFVALLNLGNSASLSGAPGAASRCFDAASSYISDTYALFRYDAGVASHALRYGEAGRAARIYSSMLKTADEANLPPLHMQRSVATLGLARAALDQHQSAAAEMRLAEAVGPISARGDVGQLIQALRLHANARRDLGDPAGAETALRAAANLIEAVPTASLAGAQRAEFVATQHDVFADWIELAANAAVADSARVWAAFRVSERGRARSLRLASFQVADSAAPVPDEEAAYRKLQSEVGQTAQAPGFREHWSERLVSLVSNAQGSAPDASAAGARTLGVLRRLDATLVEYVAANDRLFAFVADARGIQLYPLGPVAPARGDAARLLAALRNPEATERSVEPIARDLARRIWWPLAAAVTHPRVIIVPDDALHVVPFAVLPASDSAAAPLITHLELSIASSAGLLDADVERGPERIRRTRRFVLFGDPVAAEAAWNARCNRAPGLKTISLSESAAALPGSRREVLEAATIARRADPGLSVDLHVGCDATRTALDRAVSSDPALLHIATHGSIDAARPRLSALVLSGTSEGSTDFSVADILRHRLSTELVVLSACDTSAGQLLPGEGVLGPAQAFLQAGAHGVIGSAWKVPDDRTAELMLHFYAALLGKGMRASAALRAAQLEARDSARSYAWAAFSLYGSPQAAFEPQRK